MSDKSEFPTQSPPVEHTDESLTVKPLGEQKRQAREFDTQANEREMAIKRRWVNNISELRFYEDQGLLTRDESIDIQATMATQSEINGLIDQETNALNRNGLKLELARAINHARRSGEKIAILFFDLDRFKAVNDEFGHLVGDKVLKAAVEFIERHVRDTDFVGRYGGDEFAVGLVDAQVEETVERFKHPRDAELPKFIRDYLRGDEKIIRDGIDVEKIDVSASIGGKQIERDDTVTSVLNEADAAMYQDKKERQTAR